MSEIPQELLWKAGAVLDDINMNDAPAVPAIARAILAERKRCVEAVHRAAKDFYGNPDQMYAAARIATSIEAGA